MTSINRALQLPFQLDEQLGSGSQPRARLLVSFDDADTDPPTWTDYTSRVRALSSSRGRENELGQFDAGTGQAAFDDRDRELDPLANTSVRPMNRLWILERFDGSAFSIFKGYIEAWQHTYDQTGIVDAVSTASASDEYKVLSWSAMPGFSPERSSYDEVIASDTPDGYWPLSDPVERVVQQQQNTGEPSVPSNPYSGGGLLPLFGRNRRLTAKPVRR
jgi:hypothetical protein